MSFKEEVLKLLNVAFPNDTVYRNIIPEGVSKPALSADEVSNSSGRSLSGVKSGLSAVWRVSVYSNSDANMKALLKTLEGLDNTKNDDFQRIYSDYVLTEKKQLGQILTRAFYDLTLYR